MYGIGQYSFVSYSLLFVSFLKVEERAKLDATIFILNVMQAINSKSFTETIKENEK